MLKKWSKKLYFKICSEIFFSIKTQPGKKNSEFILTRSSKFSSFFSSQTPEIDKEKKNSKFLLIFSSQIFFWGEMNDRNACTLTKISLSHFLGSTMREIHIAQTKHLKLWKWHRAQNRDSLGVFRLLFIFLA